MKCSLFFCFVFYFCSLINKDYCCTALCSLLKYFPLVMSNGFIDLNVHLDAVGFSDTVRGLAAMSDLGILSASHDG